MNELIIAPVRHDRHVSPLGLPTHTKKSTRAAERRNATLRPLLVTQHAQKGVYIFCCFVCFVNHAAISSVTPQGGNNNWDGLNCLSQTRFWRQLDSAQILTSTLCRGYGRQHQPAQLLFLPCPIRTNSPNTLIEAGYG